MFSTVDLPAPRRPQYDRQIALLNLERYVIIRKNLSLARPVALRVIDQLNVCHRSNLTSYSYICND